ncbi:MAG: hypothetical protein SCALA702_31210 [Melioribacteraceae bacterium]|nr:MAG: hypothetical protein SCALA702_31210 [Melioribacteraceae bacterium]
MRKLTLLFILLLFTINHTSAQKKDGIPVLSDVLEYFSGLENDSLTFLETNWWNNKEISEVLSGIRFSGYYTEDKTQGIVLYEVTGLPVWLEGPDNFKFGASSGFTLNPFIIQFNYSEHEIDLGEADLIFALPPINPDAKSVLVDALIVKDVHVEIDYVPLSLFWGYLHLTTGMILNTKMYFHDETSKSYFSLGLQTGAFVKYKNIFVGASIARFMIKPDHFKHSDDVKFEAGLWFDAF